MRRDLLALTGALLLHAALFVFVSRSQVRQLFPDRPQERVAFEIVDVTPPPEPPPDAAPPAEKPTPAPSPREAPELKRPEPPVDTPPREDEPAPPAPVVEAAPGESLMRLPKNDGAIGRVLGTGRGLAPSAATLEGALDVRAEGPLSDKARGERNIVKHLAEDLADDVVTAGLADDYFRELKTHVETAWRPAMKELNDGGESVTQLGMMKSFANDRVAWDEMWRAYLDLAKQYANGQKPDLEPARKERIRELMRSRKGMFRFHAISEVLLTQGPDGRIVTLEMPLSSGHPGIDEGVRDAFVEAIKAMIDPPPQRVHRGSSFSSRWRLRATWTMVPPTAFLTGAGFDITPKGFEIDVPFDIKLKTYVLLQRTSVAPGVSVGDADQ